MAIDISKYGAPIRPDPIEEAQAERTAAWWTKRLFGAFYHRAKEIPGQMIATQRSYLQAQAENDDDLTAMPSEVDRRAMADPMHPAFRSRFDKRPRQWQPSGRTAMDDAYHELTPRQRVDVNQRAKAYSDMGYPDREAFNRAMLDQRREGREKAVAEMRAAEDLFKLPEEYEESTGLAEDIAGGIGTSVGSLVAAGAGTLVGGPQLGAFAATGVAYAQMHGAKVQELEAQGVTDPQTLLRSGMVSGALQAPLEALGSMFVLSRFMRMRGVWRSFLINTVESGAGEFATEMVQAYPDAYASVIALNPDLTRREQIDYFLSIIDQLHGEALYSGVVGFGAGAITAGLAGGAKISLSAMLDTLISPKQKAASDKRRSELKHLADKAQGKRGLTESEEKRLRDLGNWGEDKSVDEILADVKRLVELDKPIKSKQRDNVRDVLAKRFGEDTADAEIAIYDAIARSWAEQNQTRPAAFYKDVIGEFRVEDFEAAEQVRQAALKDLPEDQSAESVETLVNDTAPGHAFVLESYAPVGSGYAPEGYSIRATDPMSPIYGTSISVTDLDAKTIRQKVADRVKLFNKTPELRQSFKTAPPWYSQMLNTLESKLPGKGTGKSYAQVIESWAKKGEFKAEELEWSGVLETLRADAKVKLSRDEVLTLVDRNMLRVKEVEKGERPGDLEWDGNELMLNNETILVVKKRGDQWAIHDPYVGTESEESVIDTYPTRQEAVGNAMIMARSDFNANYEQGENLPKFSTYTLPGGENYKELLMTVPPTPDFEQIRPDKKAVDKYKEEWDFWKEKVDEAHKNKDYYQRDALEQNLDRIHRKMVEDTRARMRKVGKYKSAHWDEPNVLAHVRFNERTDSEGRRVLFIEEIQSDWHQEGRKKGYKKYQDASGWKAEPPKTEGADRGLWVVYDKNGNRVAAVPAAVESEAILIASQGKMGVPDAPWKKTWPIQAFKRMVRYAAENGFDAVAWTPGEVQAERYDLSKQVDSIGYTKRNDGKYYLSIRKDGSDISQPLGLPDSIEPGDLEKYVGKEIAQKIIDGGDKGELLGLDLKVGGEGMKSFYDRLLPNEVNKFFNKAAWGKAKVGQSTITTGSEIEEGRAVGPKQLEVWSLPITQKMREKAVGEGMPLFQPDETGLPPRGSVENLFGYGPKIIKAFQAADPSTPIHEVGHVLTSILWEQRNTDYFTLSEWAGVEPERAQAGLGAWTEQELERVARAFEAYVMEGRSPTSRLREVFKKMRALLLEVYKTVTALDVKINNDVRRVFDRLLTTEAERQGNPFSEVTEWYKTEEIEAEAIRQEERRRMGMIDETAEREYDELVATARAMAAAKKADEVRKREARLEKEFRKDAKKIVEQDPFYKMLNEIVKDGGLSWNQIDYHYDSEMIQVINQKRPGIVSKNGIPADVVAMQYGYDSVSDLVEDILNTPGKEEAIRRHQDDMWRAYEQTAHLEHLETYAGSIDVEIDLLYDMMGKKRPKPRKDLKKVIREQTGQVAEEDYRQLVKDLKRDAKVARDAWNAARKATREEVRETEAEKRQEAVRKAREKYLEKIAELKEKQLERIDAIRARQIDKDTRRKTVARMKRHLKSKSIPEQFRAQIGNFLKEYMQLPPTYLIPPEQNLEAFLAEKEEGFEASVDVIRMRLAERPAQEYNKAGARKPLAIEDLQIVSDVADALAHMGRTEKKLLEIAEKKELNEFVVSAVQKMYDTFGSPEEAENLWEEHVKNRKRMGGWHRLVDWKKEWLAGLLQPEFIFDAMDGWQRGVEGVNYQIFRKIAQAEDAEMKLGEKYWQDLEEAFGLLPDTSRSYFQRRHMTDKIPNGITKEEMLMVGLNSGSEDNLAALQNYGTFDEETVDLIVDELKKNGEWAFVERVWDILETMYPMLNEVHKKITGVSLRKVEGRYFPLKYDPRLSYKAEGFRKMADAKALFMEAWQKPKVESGHRKQRVGNAGMPPWLSINVLVEHVTNALHDITHQVPVSDVQKIINHAGYRKAVIDTMGRETYKQLGPWLSHVARPESFNTDVYERMMSTLRRNTTVAILGLNIGVAAKQTLSLTQTVVELGGPVKGGWYLTRGFARFARDPVGTARFVQSSSASIRNRRKNWNRELREVYGSFNPKAFHGSGAVKDAFFYLISTMDKVATYPTWMASYLQGMKVHEGNHDMAVEYADKVVRKTQPGATPKELSMFQRGGEKKTAFIKLSGMFYTFFAKFHNMLHQTRLQYGTGHINTLQAFSAFVMLVLVPAWLADGINRLGKDRPYESWWDFFKAPITYYYGRIPYVRDVMSSLLGGFDYQFSPVSSGVDAADRWIKTMTAEDVDKTKVALRGIETSGYLIGLPGNQLSITMEGLLELANNRTSDPRALMWRQPKND